MIEAMEWKPCPFCGGEPETWGFERGGYESYQEETGHSVLSIRCNACQMDMVLVDKNQVHYEDALKELNEKWNRRTKE